MLASGILQTQILDTAVFTASNNKHAKHTQLIDTVPIQKCTFLMAISAWKFMILGFRYKNVLAS